MHVRRIEFENVRGFHKLDLDLTRPEGSGLEGWTVFAGRNGAGKSTLLECVGRALTNTYDENMSLFLFAWLRHGQERASTRVVLLPSPEDTFIGIRPDLSSRGGTSEFLVGNDLEKTLQGTLYHRDSDRRSAAKGPWAEARNGWFAAGYGSCLSLIGPLDADVDLVPRSSALATLFDERASLRAPIQWLVQMKNRSGDDTQSEEDRTRAKSVVEIALKLLSSGVLPDDVESLGVNSVGLRVRVKGVELQLREVGAGVRSIVAVVIDLLRHMWARFPKLEVNDTNGHVEILHSGVVLIDEPETHLHPSWQRKIGFWYRKHFPHIQFLVATHSPFICQAASPGGIFRLEMQPEGTTVERVSDETFKRVTLGTIDDAVLTDLFGLESLHAPPAEELRDRVATLEAKVIRHRASDEDRRELEELSKSLPDNDVSAIEQSLRKLGKLR